MAVRLNVIFLTGLDADSPQHRVKMLPFTSRKVPSYENPSAEIRLANILQI